MMPRDGIRVIGLTGPAGAGKDEAAKVLKRKGAFVINADKLAHTLYVPQSPVWRELVKAFGSKILSRGGEVNRKRLGEMVFSDKRKLQQLNQVVHPRLKDVVIQTVESRQSKIDSRNGFLVINAAVLKEIGLIDVVDEVWVVMASREKRLRRLVRSGLSRRAAGFRISSQMSQKKYLAMADVVIKNEGTIKQLNAKVQACLKV
jgi:dephospho-CoA kinase